MKTLSTLCLALLLSLFALACQQSENADQPSQNPPSQGELPETPPYPDTLRYLALGDSYTIGESVSEPERWPNQLRDSLQARGIPFSGVKIIARTGWRTDQLTQAVNQAELDSPYHLVSLLIGVNNQYQGRSVESFRPEFEGLLQRAIGLAGGHPDRVFVVSIPDYGATPFGAANAEQIAEQIDQYNAVCRQISDREQVPFYDITPISREAATDTALIAPDDLHPSGQMYTRWVALIAPSLEDRLRMLAQ